MDGLTKWATLLLLGVGVGMGVGADLSSRPITRSVGRTTTKTVGIAATVAGGVSLAIAAGFAISAARLQSAAAGKSGSDRVAINEEIAARNRWTSITGIAGGLVTSLGLGALMWTHFSGEASGALAISPPTPDE